MVHLGRSVQFLPGHIHPLQTGRRQGNAIRASSKNAVKSKTRRKTRQ
jgi:hypothetical protein